MANATTALAVLHDVGLRPLGTAVTLAAMRSTADAGISGARVVRGGDVPVASAIRPIAATPPEVAAAQRRLRVAQWLVPGCTGALFVLEALERQQAPRDRECRVRRP